MSTKRAEKKKIYKSKIIKAASDIFERCGYENTTIGQISKEAGVGVGTTYLYFKSKADLYRATIEDELHIDDFEIIFEGVDYSKNPSVEIGRITDNLISTILHFNKNMIKEYIYSFFKGDLDESGLIYKIIVEADNNIKLEFKKILEEYIIQKRFNDNFKVDLCVDIIFNNILEIFYKYMASDNFDNLTLMNELKEKIVFVIEPYEK